MGSVRVGTPVKDEAILVLWTFTRHLVHGAMPLTLNVGLSHLSHVAMYCRGLTVPSASTICTRSREGPPQTAAGR